MAAAKRNSFHGDNDPELTDRIYESSLHIGGGGSEGHSVCESRENVSRMKIVLVTMATAVVLIVEGIFNFKFVRQSQAIHLNVFFYWVQSCLVTLLFKLRTRQKVRGSPLFLLWFVGLMISQPSASGELFSFRNSALHFLPLLVLHVVLMTVRGIDNDSTLYGASGGSEIYQVGLVTAPLVVLLATWHLFQKSYPVKVTVFVGLSSLLLMAIICSVNDPYIPFKVTLTHGILGIVYGTLMGYFIVLLKKYLSMSSSSQVIYNLNFACSLALPFVVVFTEELTALRKELPGVHYMSLLHQTITMAFLKLLSSFLFLYHLKLVSPMLSLATQGLSWIFLTVALSLLGTSMNVELLVSDFNGFWVVCYLFFLPVLVVELQ